MDIYPQDLGERRRALAAVQARQRVNSESSKVRLLWLIISGLSLIAGAVLGNVSSPMVVLLAPFGVAFALTAVAVAVLRGRCQTAQDTPLTPAQVLRMLAGCDDSLEKEYLRLVAAAVQLPAPPEQVAQSEIREAVRALGAALDRLPAPGPPRRNDSAHDLAVQAAGLVVDADREGDPVVAASLRRRAETRRGQAETLALLETMARRNAALRQELSDEMDALQTSLAAFGARGVWSVGEMADVAAGIGWIALKARAMAAAQAELDDTLHVERLSPLTPNGPGGVEQRLRG